MEKFNFFKKRAEQPVTDTTEKKVSRREFLKAAGAAVAGLALSDFSLLSKTLEASELKEDLDWKNGIASLFKDVLESKVETSGVFIESTNKKHCWKNIQDGQLTQIAVDPKKIVEEIQSLDMPNEEIIKIVHLHSHPLHSFQETSKENPKEVIEKFIDGKQRNGIILPPSDADMDVRPAQEGVKGKNWNKAFEEGGLDYKMVQQGVVDPSGIWLYSKIDPKQLPIDSALRKYLESKDVLNESWQELWKNKLENKVKTTQVGELKELLLKHSSDRIKNYLQKKTTNNPETIRTLFKGTLTYSQGLIDSFVDEEDHPLASAHQKITTRTNEINSTFKETFEGVYAKSAKGEAGKKDIRELIESARWKQIKLSFTPHSEELLNNINI